MQLIHFDVDSRDEINSTLLEREIDYVDVINVETLNATAPPVFRVWYWYRSDLIV